MLSRAHREGFFYEPYQESIALGSDFPILLRRFDDAPERFITGIMPPTNAHITTNLSGRSIMKQKPKPQRAHASIDSTISA